MPTTINSELMLQAKRLSPRPTPSRHSSRIVNNGRGSPKWKNNPDSTDEGSSQSQSSHRIINRVVDEVAKCQSYPKDQIESIVQKAELSYQQKLDQVVTPPPDDNDDSNNQDGKDSTESKLEPNLPVTTAIVGNNADDVGGNDYIDNSIESNPTSTEYRESKMTSIANARQEYIYNNKPSTSPVKYNSEAINSTDGYSDRMENIYLNKPNTSPVNSRLAKNQKVTEDNLILPKYPFGDHLYYLPVLCKTVNLKPNQTQPRQSQKSQESRIQVPNKSNSKEYPVTHPSYELYPNTWALTDNMNRYSLGTLRLDNKSKKNIKSSSKYPIRGIPPRQQPQSMAYNYYNQLYQPYTANQLRQATNQYASQYHNGYRLTKQAYYHKRKGDNRQNDYPLNPWIRDSTTASPMTVGDRSQFPDDNSDYITSISQIRGRSNTNNSAIASTVDHDHEDISKHLVINENYDGDISNDAYHQPAMTTPVDADDDDCLDNQSNIRDEDVSVFTNFTPPSPTTESIENKGNEVAMDSEKKLSSPGKTSLLPVIHGKNDQIQANPSITTESSSSAVSSINSDKTVSLSKRKISLTEQGKSKSTSALQRYPTTTQKAALRKGLNGISDRPKHQDTSDHTKESALSTLSLSNDLRNGSQQRRPLPDELIVLNLTKKLQKLDSKSQKQLISLRDQPSLHNTTAGIDSYSRRIEAMTTSKSYFSPRTVGQKIDRVLNECLTSQQVLTSTNDFSPTNTLSFTPRSNRKVITRSHLAFTNSHPNDDVMSETSVVSVKGNKLTYI